jgi:predicted nucleotidyltransferase
MNSLFQYEIIIRLIWTTMKGYSDIDIAVVSPSFKKMDIFEGREVLDKKYHQF